MNHAREARPLRAELAHHPCLPHHHDEAAIYSRKKIAYATRREYADAQKRKENLYYRYNVSRRPVWRALCTHTATIPFFAPSRK